MDYTDFIYVLQFYLMSSLRFERRESPERWLFKGQSRFYCYAAFLSRYLVTFKNLFVARQNIFGNYIRDKPAQNILV